MVYQRKVFSVSLRAQAKRDREDAKKKEVAQKKQEAAENKKWKDD